MNWGNRPVENPESGVLFLRSVAYLNLATNIANSGSEKVLCVWAAPRDDTKVHKGQRFDLYDLAKNSEIGLQFYHNVVFRLQALEKASRDFTKSIIDGDKDQGGSRSPEFQVETRRKALQYFIEDWSIRPEVSKVFSAQPTYLEELGSNKPMIEKTAINTYRMVLVPLTQWFLKSSRDFERKHGIAAPPHDLNIRAHMPAPSVVPSAPSSRRSSIKSRSNSVASQGPANRNTSSAGSKSSSQGAASGKSG